MSTAPLLPSALQSDTHQGDSGERQGLGVLLQITTSSPLQRACQHAALRAPLLNARLCPPAQAAPSLSREPRPARMCRRVGQRGGVGRGWAGWRTRHSHSKGHSTAGAAAPGQPTCSPARRPVSRRQATSRTSALHILPCSTASSLGARSCRARTPARVSPRPACRMLARALPSLPARLCVRRLLPQVAPSAAPRASMRRFLTNPHTYPLPLLPDTDVLKYSSFITKGIQVRAAAPLFGRAARPSIQSATGLADAIPRLPCRGPERPAQRPAALWESPAASAKASSVHSQPQPPPPPPPRSCCWIPAWRSRRPTPSSACRPAAAQTCRATGERRRGRASRLPCLCLQLWAHAWLPSPQTPTILPSHPQLPPHPPRP